MKNFLFILSLVLQFTSFLPQSHAASWEVCEMLLQSRDFSYRTFGDPQLRILAREALKSNDPKFIRKFLSKLTHSSASDGFGNGLRDDEVLIALLERIPPKTSSALSPFEAHRLFTKIVSNREKTAKAASPLLSSYRERTERIIRAAHDYFIKSGAEQLVQVDLRTEYLGFATRELETLYMEYPEQTLRSVLNLFENVQFTRVGYGGFNQVYEVPHAVFPNNNAIPRYIRSKPTNGIVEKISFNHILLTLRRELNLYAALSAVLNGNDHISLAKSSYVIVNGGKILVTVQEKALGEPLEDIAIRYFNELKLIAGEPPPDQFESFRRKLLFRDVYLHHSSEVQIPELQEVFALLREAQNLDEHSELIALANKESHDELKRAGKVFGSNMPWGKIDSRNISIVKNIDANFKNLYFHRDPETGKLKLKIIDF